MGRQLAIAVALLAALGVLVAAMTWSTAARGDEPAPEQTEDVLRVERAVTELAPAKRAAAGAVAANKRAAGPAAGTAPASPNEQSAIDNATKSAGPVNVGGKGIRPGAGGAPFKAAGFGTDLPPLVLLTLVALVGAMIAGGVLAAQRRWPALARGMPAPIRKLTDALRDGISRLRR